MARDKDDRRVDLEDLAAAAMAGVSRALAARQPRPGGKFKFPIWVGFMADPDWGGWPWPFPTEPGADEERPIPLTARDHTIIVEAVVRHALPLFKALGLTRDPAKTYTPDDILNALRRIAVSDDVRDSVNRTLHWRKFFAGVERGIDAGTQSKIDALMGRIRAAGSIDEKIRILQEHAARSGGDDEGFAVGARTAAAMLQLGQATIYDPAFYGDVLGGGEEGTVMAKSAAGEILEADVAGAVSGGVTGAVTGLATPAGPLSAGALAAIGAAAGGIGNSIGKAASKLWDSIFG